MDRMTVKIDGMSCGHCVRSVTSALGALEGVQVEQVQVGQATISYDPGAASPDRIRKAIEEEGFSVASTAG